MTYTDAYDPLEGIAITGVAGRCPESPNVAPLWQNLLSRRECITRFAPEELEPARREDMLAGYTLMREKGVHTWECHLCFPTLAHSDADLDRVVATLADMQAVDFLPKRDAAPRKGRDASGREAWFVPDPDRPGKYLQVADANA